MLTLTAAELAELTGYKQPAAQLAELHRQGFHRARRSVNGGLILERTHYDAVRHGAIVSAPINYAAIIPRPVANSSARSMRRHRALQLRTPAWAEQRAIDAIYAEASRLTQETGIPHHVDHEVPLQGKLVSGLHVENNLRVMVGADNILKHNHFTVE